MIIDDKKVYTIKDIYAQNTSDNTPMLSQYPATWWQGYVLNYSVFDRRFKKLYTSWYPFDQDPDDGRAGVADEFRADVYAHLMANDKRYAELYRINVIPDNDAYSLTNNVDYTETTHRVTERDVDYTKGSQTDSDEGFTAFGSQTVQRDIEEAHGQQKETIDGDHIIGQRQDETEDKTSAFNESSYQPKDKREFTSGEQSNYDDVETTYASYTDNTDDDVTYGSHRDDRTNIHNEGSRNDQTDDDTTEDIATHKVGNMGVQTVDDMLLKHWENWTLFDFYGFIFKEIARDLLRGC